MSSVAETAEQGMDQWRAILRKYDYTIMHIAGDRNCWGDLLLRCVTVESVLGVCRQRARLNPSV